MYYDTGTNILGTNMYVYCRNAPVNYEDSGGQFDARVHTKATMEWAEAFFIDKGFSETMAKTYAKIFAIANQSVDDIPTSPYKNWSDSYAQSWHFNINFGTKAGSPNDSRAQRYQESVNTAVSILGDDELGNDTRIVNALIALGRGLHAQQDMISHRGLADIPFPDPQLSNPGPLFHFHLKIPKTDFLNPDAPVGKKLIDAEKVTKITLNIFYTIGKANGLF